MDSSAKFRGQTRADTLIAVVTFNPDEDLVENLRALRQACGEVLIVDNGSRNVADVEAAAAVTGCRLMANAENLGIAAALSQAAQVAQQEGFAWLATFDQDSRLEPGTIDALLELRDSHSDRDRIAIVAPSHWDRNGGRDYHLPFDILREGDAWREVRSTITSGSLIATGVFGQLGLFDEALFIDAVDHDFCLRCRRAGYLIIESKAQVLAHSMGDVTPKRLFGVGLMLTNHSPVRRYYMTRNALEVYRRYLTFDPIWSLRGFAHLPLSITMTLIFESQRRAKFAAICAGARDFVLRRFGPYRR
jgi:rhamnosyltransferase